MIKQIANKYNSFSSPLKASFWFLICGVLTKAISFLVVPILTRLLSTEDYGLYSLFLSWEQIIIIFTSLNLFYNGFAVGISKFESDLDKYTSSVQGLYTTLTFFWYAVYIIYPSFWEKIFDLNTELMHILFIYLLFSPAYEFWCCRKRYYYDYQQIVIATMVVVFLSPLLMILLLKTLDYSPVVLSVLGKIIIPLLISVAIYFEVFKRGKTFYNRDYWIYSLKFNIPLLPHYLSLVMLNQLDRVMIDKMCSYSEVAKYSVVYSASMILLIVNTAVNNVLTPWIIQNLRKNRDYDFGRIVFITTIIIFVLNFSLMCIGPEALRILAPMQYYDAVWMIPPIAMSVVLRFIYQQYVNVEFFFEETRFTSLGSLIAAGLNVMLNYTAIKIFGYIAAAYTTYICYLMLTIGHYFFCKITITKQNSNCIVLQKRYLVLILVTISCLLPVFMLMYDSSIIRYSFLTVIVAGIFWKRKAAVTLFREVLGEKQ